MDRPPEAVRGLIAAAGVAGRRLRTAVRLLTEGPRTLAELIQESTVDRRTAQALLAAIGADLVTTGDRLRIAPGRVDTYRELIDYPRLVETEPVDPLARRLAGHGELVERVRGWIAGAPRAREALDHVSATAETVVRRALWLDSAFELSGARLLCVGDHDLTSLAVAALRPDVEVTVVDVDDAILEHIDAQRQPSIRCLWSDLRFGLAPGAREWGDLVFTDPPYTPDGVRLFLARGVEGLREQERARLVMAYGFGEHHPALGLKVQQAVVGLHLVAEAILPAFNRYDGAQAVGSSSDLYVLRPTGRSAAAARGAGQAAVNIYTQGAQSVEAGAPSSAEVIDALREAAAGPQALPVVTIEPRQVLHGDLPRGAGPVGGGAAAAADLTADPGGWLARVLIAVDAPRLAILVPNNHPDLRSQASQQALRDLVASRYLLRLRRSTPTPRHAIVEATRAETSSLDPAARMVREVLDRAHGKVGNTWREALIRAHGGALTKNEARARIRAAAPAAPLDEPLITLPRHRLAEVVAAVAASAAPA